MNTLTVHLGAETRKLSFTAPETLAKVLERGGIYTDKPCGGRGSCGKCRAELKGAFSEPNEREKAFGARLVCQAVLLGDAEATFPTPSGLEQIELNGMTAVTPTNPMPGKLGAAIDIGTTTLAVRIYDLKNGTVLGESGAENPQRSFAADVMGRISAAMSGSAEIMRAKLTDALGAMLTEILSRAGRSGDEADPNSLALVVTGNTTMLYLLTGQDVTCLSHAPFEADRLFDEELPLLGGEAYLPPCISAFVGADISCAVLSSGMCRDGETNILCDIGTNGEIAVWRDGKLYVTSTAAGPAFEGAGISCGCGSVRGAIDKVWIECGGIRINTIKDAPPVGICGSGLLDAIAMFLKLGMIDETGAAEEELLALCPEVKLTKADVRSVQLAKAAIAAGLETLMKIAGVKAEEVSRVYIAGGFGGHINVQSAVRIGLLPKELSGKVRFIGNGALAGAEKLLLDRSCRSEMRRLAKEAVPVNLGGDPDFNERFIDNLYFDDGRGAADLE